jgi:predicted nucleotidyltransferase
MGMNASTIQSRSKAPAKPRSPVLRVKRSSMVDALFSSTQQRVLGLLFGQPERSFFATEIIARVGAGSGAVQRELKKLADSGLVQLSQQGNQKHYQANPAAPIYPELCALIRKTVGLADPIRLALEPKRKAIELALIYGSVAKQQETASSDIDLLVVSDTLTLEGTYRLLARAEQQLGRKINPTLFTTAEFNKRRSAGTAFLQGVMAGETIVLFGTLPNG